MAKLSALATSANVGVPFGPKTISCPWLAYNHYGKSEVTLYVPNCPAGVVPTIIGDIKGVYNTVTQTTSVGDYFGTPVDTASLIAIPYLLPDILRKSLIPVRIYGGKSYADRSIFAASSRECESSSVAYFSLETSSQWGTAFSTLNARIKTYDPNANFQMRGHISGSHSFSSTGGPNLTINGYAPAFLKQNMYITYSGSAVSQWGTSDSQYGVGAVTGLAVECVVDNPVGFQKTVNPSYVHATGGGSSNQHDEYISAVEFGGILMCLDGNCEVTGSGSNWTISKAGAVESYRKINGVWYRTV